MSRVKVAVNGYGVIGKRVVDAVRKQDDLELVGVADIVTDYRIKTAAILGIPVFAAAPEKATEMRSAGIPVAGTVDELLSRVDVAVDCTPKKIAAGNKARYEKAGIKAIFQGGEAHALTGHSFVAQANYETALGRSMTRIVSCNTTSIVRTLTALKKAGLLKRARGTLIRRASDPWESHLDGILNTVVPEKVIPSHQGPDARTVDPDLDVVTIAVKAPENISHLHTWWVELTRSSTKEEVLAAFRAAPRIAFVRMEEGVTAINSTKELMSDLGRSRADLYEVGLWEDVLTVERNEVYYTYQVDNQAIVIPETIDAIRALAGIEKDAMKSIEKTDRALGVVKEFLQIEKEKAEAA
ncbi:type II glyceraldehyde-3-phosphate dehydrogenase [Candidatus Manganitrophus noduliformans]|uniref:Type II glyceraldehyde-3-phosphate dehydrogenase n=1 Tax=Candidatus Manganitrophus noduliformans TaxID=2606439 RepID=A0A7X6DTB7_9BACT|nr:type II glyceraldehyde-3-phosphate dehydrogenase [Candidatus Manganitrophus noduliformans]NKE72663.1 type II glyceraldehyde-3-phosphate dehydrogenase [Candidatus Manganitrophus noduliformans]